MMRHFSRLFLNRINNLGVATPRTLDPDTRNKIYKNISINVLDRRTLRLFRAQRNYRSCGTLRGFILQHLLEYFPRFWARNIRYDLRCLGITEFLKPRLACFIVQNLCFPLFCPHFNLLFFGYSFIMLFRTSVNHLIRINPPSPLGFGHRGIGQFPIKYIQPFEKSFITLQRLFPAHIGDLHGIRKRGVR